MNYWLLFIPLLTAFTGWLVIYLSVKMLFRPLQPRKLGGITWQGLLPAQKEQLAVGVGKLVAKEFSNLDAIEKKIGDPKHFENVRPLIETHIDDFLRNKLKEQMPMIGMFIGDKTIGTLKTIFIQEIETLFPQVMQKFAGNLKNELNIEQLVSSRIAVLSPQQIENMFHQGIGKEVRRTSLLAVAIGLLIGLLQLLIIFVTH